MSLKLFYHIQIFHLKCTKFNFVWGSALEPSGGAYSTLLDLLAGFRNGREMEKGERERKEERKRKKAREERGRGR